MEATIVLCDVSTIAVGAQCIAPVLRGIERNGPHDTDTLSLDVEDETGRVTTIAHGQALAALAQRELAKERLSG
jgi:hypothetical protein